MLIITIGINTTVTTLLNSMTNLTVAIYSIISYIQSRLNKKHKGVLILIMNFIPLNSYIKMSTANYSIFKRV